MDTQQILLIVFGLMLVLIPSAIGIRWLRQWFSENNWLERRMQDVEKDARYF